MVRAFVGVLVCAVFGALFVAAPVESQVGLDPFEGVVVHVPPVDGSVIDPFRPPAQPWLPGNRGLEYETEDGQPVRASADGFVTFAGQVGGDLFVTVRHADGIRTTVGFLAEIHVAAGETVQQGTLLGTAAESIHFTARRGDTYFDPELLFVAVEYFVRLIPAV